MRLTKYISYLLAILAILTFSCPVFLRANNRILHNVSISDGLSSLLVNVIYKDSDGFVWIGTDNSLDRFDGQSIRNYPLTSADMQLRRVNAITETDPRYLWVGNGQGLWRLDRNTDMLEQFAPDIINCTVRSLYNDGAGRLYIGTVKGIFIYENGDLRNIKIDEDVLSPDNLITGIAPGENGIVWLINRTSLLRLDTKTEHITPYTPRLAPHAVLNCLTLLGGTVYIGTDTHGVIRFDTGTRSFTTFVNVNCNIISSISSDGNDLIYVSTDGNGVHILSHSGKNTVESISHDPRDRSTIPSNSVYTLLADRDGILWLGFYQSGFVYELFQNNLCQTYGFPPKFDSYGKQVRSFLIHQGRKLIGTRDGLFYIDESRGIVLSYNMPELRSNLILSTHYFDGEYYIGTYGGGLSVLDAASLKLSDFDRSDANVFRQGHIFCMHTDHEGNMWFGTSEGVFRLDAVTGNVANYTHLNSAVPEGNVYDIFFDSANKGWICTESGMCIYNPRTKSFIATLFPEGFIHREKVRTVYEDSSHTLYFLPEKGDIMCSDLNMNDFNRMSINPAVKINSFMSVVEDRDRWLWIGCDNGLLRGQKGSETFNMFNFSDGLPSPTFTNDAAYMDDEGTLWFGNSKGLVSIDPAKLKSASRNPYDIKFTDIYVNGSRLDTGLMTKVLKEGEMGLNAKENNITFRFINLLYTDPAVQTYEYILEPAYCNWTSSASGSVSYYDLPAGSYFFRVRIPGDEQSEVGLHVVIKPMFTTWHWILFIIIATGSAYILFRVVSKKRSFRIAAMTSENGPVKSDGEKYKTNRLTGKECAQIAERLAAYMETSKPYINPDLKIADLAAAIGTSPSYLSYMFNQHLKQPYYDYINMYRVDEFKRMIAGKQYSHYTLSSMAELCGFSSRASFFRSFKKLTGITPSEYMKQSGLSDK